MRLLVTRPEPDALLLKGRLEALHHAVTVAPLLSVSFEAAEEIDVSEVQALIATSRNGLKALKVQNAHKIAAMLPLYAVGQATARDAAALGFTEIIVGGGTVATLVPEIVASADPQAGVLLHLAGDEVAGNLVGELELHGFRVVQVKVYHMVPAAKFDDATAAKIRTGEIDGVLLFSPRTAAVYARLITDAGLSSQASQMTHYCLSSAVARRLAPLGSLRIETASVPTLAAVLDLLL